MKTWALRQLGVAIFLEATYSQLHRQIPKVNREFVRTSKRIWDTFLNRTNAEEQREQTQRQLNNLSHL